MRAKCKRCGDTVEVTKLREFRYCKCGAIALDYGDGENYYRAVDNPENFDGEIEDAPKIRSADDSMERAMGIIGEENIGGESRSLKSAAEIAKSHERKIMPIVWGNSFDESVSGIVAVKDEYGTRLFFGSRACCISEKADANYIADWGNEITKETLESLMSLLKGE